MHIPIHVVYADIHVTELRKSKSAIKTVYLKMKQHAES